MMEFTFKKREMIFPSPPSPPHVVTLSSLDQIMPPVYTSTLYFFDPPPSSTPPPSESLTLSLALTLAAFPPLAGRLKPRCNGSPGMDVECHNQGALFVEAHTTITLDDLLTTGNGDVRRRVYELSPVWYSLVPNPNDLEGDLSTNKPLLLVQLTRLACGGLVVGMLFHHLVVDGTARMHFTASWAELARGQPITAHPHLDRMCIEARACPLPTFQHKEYTIRNSPTSPFTQPQLPRQLVDADPIATRIFEFRPEEIQALRDRADADAGGGEPCTAFQALTAHIWKHVTRTRQLSHHGAPPHPSAALVKLGWPVNGRDRFRPPLPAHYFGNAIFCVCVEASLGDVATQPMGVAAERIRRATRAVTDEYMASAMSTVMGSPGRICFDFMSPGAMLVTSWIGFKVYEMDWGWGSPRFFACLVSPIARHAIGGAMVFLLPNPDRHAVSALIVLRQLNMDALLADTEFYPISG